MYPDNIIKAVSDVKRKKEKRVKFDGVIGSWGVRVYAALTRS